jgi:hypothetical protein
MIARDVLRGSPYLGALCALLLSACAESPAAPTAEELGQTFVGVLSVTGADELGGLIQVSTPAGAAVRTARTAPSELLHTLGDLLVPPLLAQSGQSVTGVLMTNGGPVVQLTGTLTGGSLTLTGGAYTILATVTGTGALTGTGTVPGGLSGAITVPPTPPVTTPPASDPTGTYTGAFQVNTTIWHRNTNSAGTLVAACFAPIRIDGTVTLSLSRGRNGTLVSHVDLQWTEASVQGSNCPSGYSHAFTDYRGIDFVGTPQSLVGGRVDTGTTQTGGRITRPSTFAGAVSGSQVVGAVLLSYQFSVSLSGETHVEWYANTSAPVTLTRR